MSWKIGFYNALRDYLVTQGIDAVEVTGVDQENPSEWYCNTCGPDPIIVRIYYIDDSGQGTSFGYYGDMGELIRAL